ncbi:MAG: transglutaminase family protein [Burkholderiales bacterium]|nr:transglutaminase family protein [Burkholderiales bacterium]
MTHTSDNPADWLHSTPLLDLGDTRVRLRARSLTQLARNEREKGLAIYAFVKSMPYAKRIKLEYPTARRVLDLRSGDGDDKATLLVALLRAADIPARIRYMEMRGTMLRGLVPAEDPPYAARPLAEIWLGRWVRTDTYIFDAAYVAAALRHIREQGWDCGWGIHRKADLLWNGKDDAFLGGLPIEQDPMLTRCLCVASDPLELVSPGMRRKGYRYRRTVRALQWNVLAPAMRRSISQLRDPGAREGHGQAAANPD